MNMSRKEFFRQSIFSLGKTITEVAEAVKPKNESTPALPGESGFTPHQEEENMSAVSCNEHCLARNSGCFACFERCASQAILVVMGEGIRIDPALCNGCGGCEYVCPATPKAIRLQPRA
jgi:ferredoxin